MVKRPGLLAFSVFLGVFAVYAYTAYPTAAPRDSADLAAAVLAFAPAHPPGYPLYVLLGKAWLALDPWGDALVCRQDWPGALGHPAPAKPLEL